MWIICDTLYHKGAQLALTNQSVHGSSGHEETKSRFPTQRAWKKYLLGTLHGQKGIREGVVFSWRLRANYTKVIISPLSHSWLAKTGLIKISYLMCMHSLFIPILHKKNRIYKCLLWIFWRRHIRFSRRIEFWTLFLLFVFAFCSALRDNWQIVIYLKCTVWWFDTHVRCGRIPAKLMNTSIILHIDLFMGGRAQRGEHLCSSLLADFNHAIPSCELQLSVHIRSWDLTRLVTDSLSPFANISLCLSSPARQPLS